MSSREEEKRTTHIRVEVLQRLPALGFLGPHRRKESSSRPSIPTAQRSLPLPRLAALLDRNLNRLCLLLLQLRIRDLLVVLVVVGLSGAFCAALDGEDVVEIGEGRAELVGLVDGVEVEGVYGGETRSVGVGRDRRGLRTVLDDANEVRRDFWHAGAGKSHLVEPPRVLVLAVPRLIVLVDLLPPSALLLGLLALLVPLLDDSSSKRLCVFLVPAFGVLLHGDGDLEVLTVGLEFGLEFADGGVGVASPVWTESGRQERVGRVGVGELVGVLEEAEGLEVLRGVVDWQAAYDGIVVVVALISIKVLVGLLLDLWVWSRGGGDGLGGEVLVLVCHLRREGRGASRCKVS